MSQLFAPVCSITTTKRRRFFWAAWWSAPPRRVPFRRPDAEGGGASTREEAYDAAVRRAGVPLAMIDPLWARAWIRILRGEPPWPTRASRGEGELGGGRAAREPAASPDAPSIWAVLGVSRDATETELKAAYRRRVLETHPDHGGDEASLRRVVSAYEEARRRMKKPRRRR